MNRENDQVQKVYVGTNRALSSRENIATRIVIHVWSCRLPRYRTCTKRAGRPASRSCMDDTAACRIDFFQAETNDARA